LVTRNLLEGAMGSLKAHGVKEEDIDVAWVPGVFEIPLIAQTIANIKGISLEEVAMETTQNAYGLFKIK